MTCSVSTSPPSRWRKTAESDETMHLVSCISFNVFYVRLTEVTEMRFENRDTVLGHDPNIIMGEPSTSAENDDGWEDIEGFHALPPGEESMFMGNTGGEDNIFHEIIDYALPTKYVMVHLLYAY